MSLDYKTAMFELSWLSRFLQMIGVNALAPLVDVHGAENIAEPAMKIRL